MTAASWECLAVRRLFVLEAAGHHHDFAAPTAVCAVANVLLSNPGMKLFDMVGVLEGDR